MGQATLQTQTSPRAKNATRTLAIECTKEPSAAPVSGRVTDVAMQFGLPVLPPSQRVLEPLTVTVGRGRIVFIVGPSGSGKSTALNLIKKRFRSVQDVGRVRFPVGRSVVDVVCQGESLSRAIQLLGACGLGESPLWVRLPHELSDGQQFRARLARAIGMLDRSRSASPIVCDEFCSGLHRRLAKSIAFNLRKLVSRRGLSLILACSDDDILTDLQPDLTVRLLGHGQHELIERKPRQRSISFLRRLVVEPGRKSDYESFAAMHYRATDELGFVDKVFVLRERSSRDLLGIVVYSHGPLELSLRNKATGGRFLRNPTRLNCQMRILRRLVIHPDVRGCGIGHRLVSKTLPRVGTRFVECLASMGEVNPVFERAGMTRIGTCPVPSNRSRFLGELRAMDVDPFAREFVMQVSRRPRVRRIVSQLVYQWYQATTADGEKRVARQSPEFLAQTFRGLIGTRPVYFLWERPRKTRR